ncbi:MAG: AAA family ATPase [Lachnospiraceae bacterium]|nr:AAA family ATPase [Lachnospiraceae bacterium]
MRIRKIYIENFGKLHHLEMDLKDGLNLVCEANGWGKTTLAAFVKAMFYGLDYTTKRSLKDNERKRYMPWQGGAFGGSLEFETGDGCYRVERFFGARDKEDSFVLYDLETGLLSERYSQRLGGEIFGLDRAAYERSCFLGQQDLAVTVNDSLNAGLTHVEEDAGDMHHYEQAMHSLETRMKYFQKTGGRGQIGKIQEQRSQLKEELAECHQKEIQMRQWQERIQEKAQQEKYLRMQIASLENQEQSFRDYEVRTAQKAQHDLLKKQAVMKEEQLRTTAGELAEYVSVPLKEKVLDQCREQIYQVHTMQMQEEFSEDQVRHTKYEVEKLHQDGKTLKGQNAYWLSVVFGVLGILVGAVFFWMEQVAAGILFAVFGLLGLFYAVWRYRRYKQKWNEWNQELEQAEITYKKAETEHLELQKSRKDLEKKICQTLQVPDQTEFRELEIRWKKMRQETQRYSILKQTYEVHRQEAQRSREDYLEYRNSYPEEEWEKILNVQKPELEKEELCYRRNLYQSQHEEVLEELQDMQNQMMRVREWAERIPELEEEHAYLDQELEKAVCEHRLLEKTMQYLRTARDQFSVRYLRDLQNGIEQYVHTLVPEVKLAPTVDVKLKVGFQEAGTTRDLESLSAGWQDLIQLAERFSIVDALYQEEQPVLILDDPFVNLDDRKRRRAMRLLNDMAEKRQMIYFTCRS